MLRRRLTDWLQHVRGSIYWRRRVHSAHHRALPHLIIIGAQKSGTSSLFNYLAQHPQLHPSCRKEIHYFDRYFSLGLDWYKAHFPQHDAMQQNDLAYEASPNYLCDPYAPQRIFELLPSARLIALLRNPTERAISHYFHEKRHGRETLSIMQTLAEEEQRIAAHNNSNNTNPFRRCYKLRGRYHEQLQRFLTLFPQQQLLVINSNDLFSDPAAVLHKTFRFLGVDDSFHPHNLHPHNVGSNTHKVEPEVYNYLNDYFRPHNQSLYDLLNRDLGW